MREIASAAAYYQDTRGFNLDWGGEELGLAGISKGNCRMFLADQEYRKEYGNVGPTLIWLNLESKEEVDQLYRVWTAGKARLMSAPESKPWGLHELTAADLDGNLLRVFCDFATPAAQANVPEPHYLLPVPGIWTWPGAWPGFAQSRTCHPPEGHLCWGPTCPSSSSPPPPRPS